MRIVFCKISNMKYYKGVGKNDEANFGGSFVKENGYGHEEFNFLPITLEDTEEFECFGFFEPKSNNGKRNMVHIEKIEGCAGLKNESQVDDVLVVWCATREQGDITVVGWYKHATIYRELQDWTLRIDDKYEEERCYNVRAKASDCVLLPMGKRNRSIWSVPSARYTKAYGFGQSMIWYPTETAAQEYVKRLIQNIENYNEDNWLNEFPDDD